MFKEHLQIDSEEKERLKELHRLNILDTASEKMFDNITKLASQICNTKISLITFVDEDRQWFKSKHGIDVEETGRDVSFCNHAIQKPDDLLIVNDAREDNRFFDNPLVTGDFHLRFYAGAPLLFKNQFALGTLCVIHDEPMELSAHQQEMLKTLSDQVVEMIQMHELSRETAALQDTNKSVAEKLNRIVNSVRDIIYEMDAGGQFTFVNAAMQEITGFTEEELLNMGFWSLVLEEDRQRLWDFYHHFLKRQIPEVNEFYEFRIETKEGKTRRLRQKVRFRYQDHVAVNTYAVATDITDLHAAEEDKRRSLRQYRLLAENSTDMICLNDPDGTYKYVSPSVEQTFGFKAEEMIGKRPYDFFHPDDIEPTRLVVQERLERGETITALRFRFALKSGGYKWTDTVINPIMSKGALIAFQTTSRDITSQVLEEQEQKKYYDNLTLIDKIASRGGGDFQQQIQDLLETARSYFDLPIALVSSISDEDYEVSFKSIQDPKIDIKVGDHFDLKETYCSIVYEREKVLSFHDVEQSPHSKHPCFKAFGLRAYIGANYKVDGANRGTINFSGPDSRLKSFGKREIEFIEVLASSIGFLISISEKQEKLSKERNLLRSFVNNAPATMAMFNRDMDYLAVSPTWAIQNGLVGKKYLGKNHYHLCDDVTEEWREIHESCLNGEIVRGKEEHIISQDGRSQWLQWQVLPWYTLEGSIGGIIAYNEDITDLKEQHSTLQKARIQAEEAAKMKEDFLSTMSHEIRTPLNSIIGFSNVLLRDNPRPDQLESLKLLKFSGENLLALIENILDISKIQAGKIDIESIDFDLHQLVESIVRSLKLKATEKHLDLDFSYDPDLPKLLKGDKGRLAQILNNLIGNAIKFTQEGRVDVFVKKEGHTESGTQVRFEIADTGIGIPTNKKDFIFDAFAQASTSDARLFGGTGLGLTISKNLVELMGGRIKVSSKEGDGSVFSFSLNMLNAEESQGSGQTTSSVDFGEKIDYDRKILLVEDNLMNQLVAVNFLEDWGLQVDVAENGLVALKMIEDYDYGMILIDLQMPKMDGYEASGKIRQMDNSHYSHVPIIALTASAMIEIKDRALDAGMNDYISKPFDPKELHGMLVKYLLS